jgi:hypothetical protein
LNKHLSITQRGLRGVITGDVVALPHTKAIENAVYGDLAKRSGIEIGWREA